MHLENEHQTIRSLASQCSDRKCARIEGGSFCSFQGLQEENLCPATEQEERRSLLVNSSTHNFVTHEHPYPFLYRWLGHGNLFKATSRKLLCSETEQPHLGCKHGSCQRIFCWLILLRWSTRAPRSLSVELGIMYFVPVHWVFPV